MPVTMDPSMTPQFVGHANILALYCIPKTTTVEPAPATNATSSVPSAPIITQGPPPGIPMDSAMEVIDQVEPMNLIAPSPVQDAMLAIWSVNLAKKYRHLPWTLLNESSQVKVLMAADVVLIAPVSMRLLGPDVARWALEFIANETITIWPVEKFLFDGEPSSLAVDAVRRAVEQASWILLPAVAATPLTAAPPVAATPPTAAPPVATTHFSRSNMPQLSDEDEFKALENHLNKDKQNNKDDTAQQ
uniref:Uncharacterized protein n=1 Tax=Romanomermis culicivorax TaxID=13658 RepID=A0A915IS06_ROMCU